MTLQDFIREWDGKPCEVTGSANAKNQCVDLANAYIRDVLGLPIIEWTDAVDFPKKAGDQYEWTSNSKDNFPSPGALVVWSTNHIAINVTASKDSFTSFDQNWPIGSVCHLQAHTYAGVLGWLTPKSIIDTKSFNTMPASSTTSSPQFTDQTLIPLGDPLGTIELQAVRSKLLDQANTISDNTVHISNLEAQVLNDATDIEALKGQLKSYKEKIDLTDSLQTRIDQFTEGEKTYNRIIGQLQGELKTLKSSPIINLILKIWHK